MPLIWPPNEVNPPADLDQKEAADIFRRFGRLSIEAAPGTGKTFLGLYLAICAFNLNWSSKENPTLFLTFSRNARVQIEQELQSFRRFGWMKPDEEKAIQIFNYHAFFFEYIQLKAGIWGCAEKLRPSSIQENKNRLENLLHFPQERGVYNQANLVYALKRFSIEELMFNGCRLKIDKETLGLIETNAIAMLRKGSPYYDDFAPLFLNLLELCPEFIEWLRIKYPVIILDEFQDTDIIQWKILQLIKPVHPVILYDRYQMIYEWRGSRVDRIGLVKNALNISSEQEKQIKNIHRSNNQSSLAQFIQELRCDDLIGNSIKNSNDLNWISTYGLQKFQTNQFIPSETRCLTWLRFNNREINFKETTAIITRTNSLADYLFENLRIRPEKGFHYLCRWIGSDDNPEEKIRDWLWRLRSINSHLELRAWIGSLIDSLLPIKIIRDLDVSFETEFRKNQDAFLVRKKKEIFNLIRKNCLSKWDYFTFGNSNNISIGVEFALEIAHLIIDGKGNLDPDLVYYLKQLSEASNNYQPGNLELNWVEYCNYLENANLIASFKKNRIQLPGLYILTIHQSKGREFDHVIIPWLSGNGETSRTPDGKKIPIKLDYSKLEDRKLLYVAMTRARRKVTIVYPQEDPSPFLRNWKLIR